MKHLLIALMLLSSFAFVIGCTRPAEDVEDTEETVSEECCDDPCELKTVTEVCEACDEDPCERPAEEAPGEEGRQ